MRVIKTKVYDVKHLKRYYSEGYARAFRNYQGKAQSWDAPWQGEIFDSLKAVFDAADVKMKNWNLGAYNRGNGISARVPGDDATANLEGPRAMAWMENHLFGPMRLGARLLGESGRFWIIGDSRGRRGLVGEIPDCPLTGYCADDDYLNDLRKSVKDGRTIKEAFEDLADVYARLLEGEIEYQQSEEAFLSWADDAEFDRDGDKV